MTAENPKAPREQLMENDLWMVDMTFPAVRMTRSIGKLDSITSEGQLELLPTYNNNNNSGSSSNTNNIIINNN